MEVSKNNNKARTMLKCTHALSQAVDRYRHCLLEMPTDTGNNVLHVNGTRDESFDGRTSYCTGILSKSPGTTSQRRGCRRKGTGRQSAMISQRQQWQQGK